MSKFKARRSACLSALEICNAELKHDVSINSLRVLIWVLASCHDAAIQEGHSQECCIHYYLFLQINKLLGSFKQETGEDFQGGDSQYSKLEEIAYKASGSKIPLPILKKM